MIEEEVTNAFNNVSEILKLIIEDNSVPKNIRRVADRARTAVNEESDDVTLQASTVISRIDEISNDPNLPIQARTLVWEALSELEAIRAKVIKEGQ